MDSSKKPQKWSIASIGKMVEAEPALPTWVEPEPGFNTQEFQDLVTAAEKDYKRLCNILKLTPVPLDIYQPVEASKEITELGTSLSNFTPGYDGRKEIIVLPVVPGTRALDLRNRGLAFPPDSWDGQHAHWPRWRSDLWHETFHQVEKHIFDTWDGSNEKHEHSFLTAIIYAAKKLSPLVPVTTQELQVLALLNIEESPKAITDNPLPRRAVSKTVLKRVRESPNSQ